MIYARKMSAPMSMRIRPLLIATIAALPLAACGGEQPSASDTALAGCKTCHTFNQGGGKRTGPNLHDIIGKTAGTQAGFVYSDAMKQSGIVWTVENLDAFIADPHKLIPRSRMGFPGEADAGKRKAMIEALKDGAK